MKQSCPECGGELLPSSEGTGLGTCAVCGESFVMVPGAEEGPGRKRGGAAAEEEEEAEDEEEGEAGEEEETASGDSEEGDEGEEGEEAEEERSERPRRRERGGHGSGCQRCGAPLDLVQLADGAVRGRCTECRATYRFVLEEHRAERRAPYAAAPRGGERAGEGPAFGRRGCRRCGGPLTLTKRPDGSIQGECRQCGNRFILRPRRGPFRGGEGSADRRGRGTRGYPRQRRYSEDRDEEREDEGRRRRWRGRRE